MTHAHSRIIALVGRKDGPLIQAALEAAEREGPVVDIGLHDLESTFQDWMATEPKTVVIDGMPNNAFTLERLKRWVCSDRMQVNRRHQPLVHMPTPTFLICIDP